MRLKGYDYSWVGWYYVTICTKDGERTLGKIVGEAMVPSKAGTIIEECWQGLPKHFPSVELGEHVVMPNHFHGIVIINDTRRGLINQTPTKEWQMMKTSDITLGKIVRHFKARATKTIHDIGLAGFQWQRNYYEHIVRNDADLHRIRTYIQNNPLQWALDEENPENNQAEQSAVR